MSCCSCWLEFSGVKELLFLLVRILWCKESAACTQEPAGLYTCGSNSLWLKQTKKQGKCLAWKPGNEDHPWPPRFPQCSTNKTFEQHDSVLQYHWILGITYKISRCLFLWCIPWINPKHGMKNVTTSWHYKQKRWFNRVIRNLRFWAMGQGSISNILYRL